MPPAKWLFSDGEYIPEPFAADKRYPPTTSRHRGRQVLAPRSRVGQTGSNWSSIEQRTEAERSVNSFPTVDDYDKALRSKPKLVGLQDQPPRGAYSGKTPTDSTAPVREPWRPTTWGRHYVPGSGSWDGTFRGRPHKHIAPERELPKGQPPPRLKHNPAQILSKPAPSGGPGTTTRAMSNFEYMTNSTPEPDGPTRRAQANRERPRAFVAGRGRTSAFDSGVYSMDAYRPKPAEAGSKPAVPSAARTESAVASWRPVGTKSRQVANLADYPAHVSDPYDAARERERKAQAAARRKRVDAKPFDPTGTSGSGPYGPNRNYVSTTAVL